MLTRMSPLGYSPSKRKPDLDMEDMEELMRPVSYKKRSKKFPTVDTSTKASGVGVQKSGYNLPPVKLPGMTPEIQKRLEKTIQDIQVRNATRQAPSTPSGTRFGPAAQGIASVVGPALIEEIAKRIPGRRTDASDFLNTFSSFAGVIPGVGPYAYLLSTLGGPLLDIIIASAEAQAKNQMVQGAMTAPVGFEEYAEFLKKNPDANLTMDEYKQYKAELAAYENSGKTCTRITQDMLGDMTLEEYAAANGIEIKEGEDQPPQYKKFTQEELRQPTKEELDILQGIRVM